MDRTSETREVLRGVADGQPVLVLGEPGSGRSSLLNHVAWLLGREAEPRESVVVSGELARNPAQLLGVLVATMQRLAEPEAPRGRWLQELQALALPDGPFGEVVQPAILMELVDLLGDRLAALDRGVCLMIDGISPTVAHAVFGSLRNELWALEGAAWVVAGDTAAGAAVPRAAGRRVLRADGRARPALPRRRRQAPARSRPGSDRRADRAER